ncbi:MAG: glycosyl transferase [Candidatus Rokubacteria bacterium 13_1_20CM_2_68_19]|nr:MAG: glycosyl transferase [Candidatus Rokubacteria bacterium 13_2_20CM_69_10]OLB42857.1 MAG: glycosyl transferase [Candidatus Rokubacteria bacterium 13_2_20CM_2_64_8]OLD96057.1 MAG: glycosyl transferase [Candidatus Rokubacteria bacterium 13_1_20CM_4_68_9]OLE42683.1 MAG: glycosyl transferase [Candidatus Rokubacteria bacterium 13_1_20CM_2_68_19]PYN62743.1 MAG: glycosyl transferase [Candidatus Rokubacteria bacterium]
MRIAQVAPLYESVPPRLYGGTERVVSWLADELVERGHEVTLFASGDSRTHARLVSAWPRALRLDPAQPDPFALHTLELAQAFSRADDFDVVHCHVDYLAFPYGRLVSTPVVHTLHGRLDLRPLIHVLTELREVPLVSISNSQREPLTGLDLNWVATVHHGLPMRDVPAVTTASDGRYLVFLGRMSAEKRPDLAIAVAKRAGLPLIMAAKVDRPDREYFEREIRPQLGHPLIEYIGEVSDAEKWRLLGDALALLFPIDWPEPFGLAMIEALACGTPVVARPCGAVPEIVRDGEVGFLADTVDELVAAVKRVDVIDRARCRRWAEAQFSVGVMADHYESVYRRLKSRAT